MEYGSNEPGRKAAGVTALLFIEGTAGLLLTALTTPAFIASVHPLLGEIRPLGLPNTGVGQATTGMGPFLWPGKLNELPSTAKNLGPTSRGVPKPKGMGKVGSSSLSDEFGRLTSSPDEVMSPGCKFATPKVPNAPILDSTLLMVVGGGSIYSNC